MLKHRPPAGGSDFSDHLFTALRIQVRSQHRRTFSRKAERSSTPDPTGRAGNHRYFSMKSAHRCVPPCRVSVARNHLVAIATPASVPLPLAVLFLAEP
jgi:hypothetical protein